MSRKVMKEEYTMKKIIRKITTVVCLCACLSISLSSTPVSAATWKNKVVNDSKGFKKAWEKTVTYKLDNKKETNIGSMTYGFNTWSINEDYVWTMSLEGYSLAEIQRIGVDNELLYGPKKGMNQYSKIEVQHKNTNVKYQIKFYATYGTIKESEANTSIK